MLDRDSLHLYNLQYLIYYCIFKKAVKTKAAIYTIANNGDQDRQSLSPAEQRTLCLAAAANREWSVAAEYSDTPISNQDEPNHSGLSALLDDARRGGFGAVIIPSLDCLGRSARLVLRLIAALNQRGVTIVSCREGLDSETRTGRYVLRLFNSLAELDHNAFVVRAAVGRDTRGRLNGERGGQVPLGYKRVFDDKGHSIGVAISAAEAETVRYLFVLRSRGNTLKAIADKLNDLGVTTSREKSWHASSVKVVLENEDKYRGGRRGESSYRWPRVLF